MCFQLDLDGFEWMSVCVKKQINQVIWLARINGELITVKNAPRWSNIMTEAERIRLKIETLGEP